MQCGKFKSKKKQDKLFETAKLPSICTKKENKIVTEIYDFDAQLIEIIVAKNAPYPIYYFNFQSFFSWSFQAVNLVTFFTILWLSMPAYLQRPRQTAILQL